MKINYNDFEHYVKNFHYANMQLSRMNKLNDIAKSFLNVHINALSSITKEDFESDTQNIITKKIIKHLNTFL